MLLKNGYFVFIYYLCVGFQAIVMVLESKGDTAIHMMMKLLQSFWKSGLITVDQMNRVSSGLKKLWWERIV